MHSLICLVLMGSPIDGLESARELLHYAVTPEERRAAYSEVLWQKERVDRYRADLAKSSPRYNGPTALDYDAVSARRTAAAIGYMNRRNYWLARSYYGRRWR